MKLSLPLAIYSLVLLAGMLLSLKLALVAWRRRAAPGAVALLLLELTAAWWMFCYLLPLPAMERSAEIFLRFRMIYFAVVLIPPAMLAFTVQYTGLRLSWKWRTVMPFMLEPAIVLLAVWWPGLQNAFFGSWRGRPGDGHFWGGILFWAHTAYSYSLLTVGFWLLLRQYRRESTLYRRQIKIMLLGMFIPVVFNLIAISGLFPADMDISPFGLVIGTGVMAVAIFRRGLLDLIPVARDKIIQVMHDGVLVVDTQDRVVDSNPAAVEMLDLGGKPLEGSSLRQLIPEWHLEQRAAHERHASVEITLDRSGKTIELRAIPLADSQHRHSGRLLVLRDVTAAKAASQALEQANERMRTQLLEIEMMQIQLREQAIRDALTGLFNRRYLEETMERELSQAQRNRQPLAVIMIDIDHFKSINDTYGHSCGDAVLRLLANLLLQKSRVGDVVCRYGGEEFVVILSATTLEIAAQRAEQWLADFAGSRLSFDGAESHCTMSAGVSVFPQHGTSEEELLGAADRALYAAKANGRNRVELATSHSVGVPAPEVAAPAS